MCDTNKKVKLNNSLSGTLLEFESRHGERVKIYKNRAYS